MARIPSPFDSGTIMIHEVTKVNISFHRCSPLRGEVMEIEVMTRGAESAPSFMLHLFSGSDKEITARLKDRTRVRIKAREMAQRARARAAAKRPAKQKKEPTP